MRETLPVKFNPELPVRRNAGLRLLLDSAKAEIAAALAKRMDPDLFGRTILTLFSSNPALYDCNGESVFLGVVQGAQLGLSFDPALGQCCLVPRKNRGRLEATFQIEYRGLHVLAHRSKFVIACRTDIRYDRDRWELVSGTSPALNHVPAEQPRGEPLAVYAVAQRPQGWPELSVWTHSELQEHKAKYVRRKEAMWGRELWPGLPEWWCRKTALRAVLSRFPYDEMLVRATLFDQYDEAGFTPGKPHNGVDLSKPGRQALPTTFTPPAPEVCPECNGSGEIDLGGHMSPCARCQGPEDELASDEALAASGF